MTTLTMAHSERGAALLTSLLILLVLSIVGLAFMGSSILAERMAANEQVSVTTTSSAQLGNNGVLGQMAREGLVIDTSIFRVARNVAVADSADVADAYSWTGNTTGIKRCVSSSGTVTSTCDGTVTVDAETNLRTESTAVYRGCVDPKSTLQFGYGGLTQLVPHYMVLIGTGWYESSGDNLPTTGSDAMSSVENTVVTEALFCQKPNT